MGVGTDEILKLGNVVDVLVSSQGGSGIEASEE
jgi:hypothetical protein